MIFPVLKTKLQKPQLPITMIYREELLKECSWANVILVSAQAGSGKSTVVSAWLSEQDRAYCWYSLDDWDNELMQFFSYVAAGIKQIDKRVSETLEQLLDAFQSIGFEAFVKALINQLHTINTPFILVLDDYHIIRNELIHQAIKTILEHLPPFMRLVLITREDPPFPLAKLRASKNLLEVRISKLKFSEAEAKAYFLEQLQLALNEEQLQHLFKRTEGWIAGLQMSALYMQSHQNIELSVKTITASHYYIMDYLLEEVLERHPPEIKSFLLATSILDSFSDDLCDCVMQLEAGTSSKIIERLVKSNSFIISLDPSGQWYRYHHLFRDLLRQRLIQKSKNELEQMNLRAGLWFKTNAREQEAIHHFIHAKAFDKAAELVECKWSEMDIQLQAAGWLDMVKKLPDDIIERSPVICMGYGWAQLDMGEIEACRAWFDKAQVLYDRYQAHADSDDIIISDTTQFNLLPATIASANGYIAAATGDIEGIFKYTQEALTLIPSDQHAKRGVVSMLLGIAHWRMGNLQEAEAVITQFLKSIRSFVNPLLENSSYMMLGELYIQQGALSKAKAMFEQTITNLIEQNQVPIIIPSLYLGLAKIAFLLNDNRSAKALLEKSKAYGQRYALMDWKYKYNMLLARVYCSEGLYDLARQCVQEGKANYFHNPLPDEITLEEIENAIDIAEASRHQDPKAEGTPSTKIGFTKEFANQSLSEPLTVRELEVLTLLTSGLSNQEICDTLFLSLSTVKGYNQNIFGKLQVNRRTQAVLKAKELDLV